MRQVMSCRSLEHYGSRLLKVDATWDGNQSPSRSERVFCIGTLCTCISNVVPGLDVCYLRSHGIHRPSSFLSEREWQRSLITADAMIDVNEVDADGFDLDPHFAFSWLWHREVFIRQCFQASILMYTNNFHTITLLLHRHITAQVRTPCALSAQPATKRRTQNQPRVWIRPVRVPSARSHRPWSPVLFDDQTPHRVAWMV